MKKKLKLEKRKREYALVIQGQITLILTPSFTALKCNPRIIPKTPCFDAVYATKPVHSFHPAILLTNIKSPPSLPFFLKKCSPILEVIKGPLRFTSISAVENSFSMSASAEKGSAGREMPALATVMSIRPHFWMAVLKRVSWEA